MLTLSQPCERIHIVNSCRMLWFFNLGLSIWFQISCCTSLICLMIRWINHISFLLVLIILHHTWTDFEWCCICCSLWIYFVQWIQYLIISVHSWAIYFAESSFTTFWTWSAPSGICKILSYLLVNLQAPIRQSFQNTQGVKNYLDHFAVPFDKENWPGMCKAVNLHNLTRFLHRSLSWYSHLALQEVMKKDF